MSFVHNLIGASSSSSPFSIINVDFPDNSSCYYVKDDTTVYSDSINGEAIFIVHDFGDYTVCATDGVNIAEYKVEIGPYEVKYISLAYSFNLYNRGQYDSTIGLYLSGGNGSISRQSGYIRYDTTGGQVSTGIACFGMVDLTSYTKIVSLGSSATDSSWKDIRHDLYVTDSVSGSPFNSNIAQATDGGRASTTTAYDVNLEIDISNISGKHYVCYSINTSNAAWSGVRTNARLYTLTLKA